jgi:protein TonB
MTKDLFAGAVLSAALHFGLVSWGTKAPPPPRPSLPVVAGCQLVMPPLDPDDPLVKVEDLPEDSPKQPPAPPSLADLPSVVPVDSLTEPLSPPPPPGFAPTSTVTIPVGTPSQSWRNGIPHVYTMDQLNEQPKARVQPQPAYPYAMSQAGISGEVVVEFVINEAGNVIDARVVRSSHPEFESPAVQAVLKWKFKPGRKDGRAVKVRASQLLAFNLNDANGQ